MLWYKNEKFWTTFFTEIGVEYIVSPETDWAILARGEMLSIDETCLPVKLLLGHVESTKILIIRPPARLPVPAADRDSNVQGCRKSPKGSYKTTSAVLP